MKYFKYIALTLLTFLSVHSYSFAQGESLQVATIVREPFVIQEGNNLNGFSIELWTEIADYLERPYEFLVQDSFSQMLGLVRKNEIDLAISNITINSERKEVMDFSDSYFEGGLQIMISRKSELNTIFKVLQERDSEIMMLIFLGLIFVISHLFWLIEKNKHENVDKKYFPGIFQSLWLVVTFGEFGNKTPGRALTKIILLLWFASLMFMYTTFTAKITTDLTLNRNVISINSYHDLHNKKVGAISGSTAESFLRKEKIQYIPYTNISRMFKDVENNVLEATVHDYPIINHYILHEGAGRVNFAGDIFQKEHYGIALPKNSVLTDEINDALLFLEDNGTYNRLLTKWFGNN